MEVLFGETNCTPAWSEKNQGTNKPDFYWQRLSNLRLLWEDSWQNMKL